MTTFGNFRLFSTKWDGTSVQRIKFPLLSCHKYRKCSVETTQIRSKVKFCWLFFLLILWPKFGYTVDGFILVGTNETKFMAKAFSFTIHTENYFFMGTRFLGSDPPPKPPKLVPYEN